MLFPVKHRQCKSPHTHHFVPDERLRNWPLAAAATSALESILQEQADIRKSKKTLAIIIT